MIRSDAIAGLMLCHERSAGQILDRAKLLSGTVDHLFIHYDGRAPDAVFAELKAAAQRLETVTVLDTRIPVHWGGDDMVAAYYSTGIRTFSSSIATVAPRLSLKLHELADAGDGEALTELLDECVIPLYALRARRKGYEVSAMKAMMDMVGLNGGPVRPPLVNVTSEEEDELRAILSTWEKFL